jgi:hypothetical protein
MLQTLYTPPLATLHEQPCMQGWMCACIFVLECRTLASLLHKSTQTHINAERRQLQLLIMRGLAHDDKLCTRTA